MVESRAWSHLPVIPVLLGLRQEDRKQVEGPSELHSKTLPEEQTHLGIGVQACTPQKNPFLRLVEDGPGGVG